MTDEPIREPAANLQKNEGIENDTGLLSPVGPAPLCPKCNEPVDNHMTTAEYYGPEGAPWFCSQCRRWAHHSCPERRSRGGRCPLCGKMMLAGSDFFCTSCMDWVPVRKGSSWPTFPCAKCGNATSIGYRSIGSLLGLQADKSKNSKQSVPGMPLGSGLFSEGFLGLLNKGPIGWIIFGLASGILYGVYQSLKHILSR
jgi:hypothetical protein